MRWRCSWESLLRRTGTTFPLAEGAAVRRINDGEAADTGELLAKQAEEIKTAISKEATLAQPDKDSVVADLNQLKEQAETVKSRASDAKPATAEARQACAIANKVQSFANGHQLGSATTQALTGLQAPLAVLKQAYGIPPVDRIVDDWRGPLQRTGTLLSPRRAVGRRPLSRRHGVALQRGPRSSVASPAPACSTSSPAGARICASAPTSGPTSTRRSSRLRAR